MIESLLAFDAETWGVSNDHIAGLKALLLAPSLVLLLARALHVAGYLKVPGLLRIAARYKATPLTLRAVSWLMTTSALVHLAVLPHHLHEGHTEAAWLFGIDCVLLIGGAAMVLKSRRWRMAAMLLLVANLVFYVGFVGDTKEAVDQLGIATKTIELMALGFLLYPHRRTLDVPIRRRRWVGATAGFLLTFTVTGVLIWGLVLDSASAQPVKDAHSHNQGHAATNHHADDPTMMMMGDTETLPTAEQIAAAEKLAVDTKVGIAKYQDIDVALADGYKPDGAALEFAVHYANKKYEDDGKLLDPTAPETLVYSDPREGPPVLLGAMYSLPGFERDAPQPGGSLTVWHIHTNICFGPIPPHFIGITSPFGSCTAGSLSVTSGAMIHVWTVDWSGGPYGELTEEEAKAIVKRSLDEGDRSVRHQR